MFTDKYICSVGTGSRKYGWLVPTLVPHKCSLFFTFGHLADVREAGSSLNMPKTEFDNFDGAMKRQV
jgi:hypothetical protein